MIRILLFTLLSLSLTSQCHGVQEYLTFNDLNGLGSSARDFVRAIYNIFHINPDGISLNHQNAGHSQDLAAKYKRWCYKILGVTNYMTESTQTSSGIVGSTHAINHADEIATVKVKLTSKWIDSAEVSTSITNGLSFKSEFEVKGLFKSGLDWSFNIGSSSSKKRTYERSIEQEIDVIVPPRSKKLIKVIAHSSKGVLHFTTPIDVYGSVGVNYASRVRGHYFWFFNVRMLVPRPRGEIRGTVSGVKVVNTDIDIGAAEPLTGDELEEEISQIMKS